MRRHNGRGVTLQDVGEHRFLSRILGTGAVSPEVLLGPGDDCAVIRGGSKSWLWTIDAIVEDSHFQRGWLSPRQLGRKSFLVNASDIAAMGGLPRLALVALNVPADYPVRDLRNIQRGIESAAKEHGTLVVGGNLTRSNVLSLTVALAGVAPSRFVARSGAKAGDSIYVTGRLGESALGLRWLKQPIANEKPPRALRRFFEPIPRVDVGRRLAESSVASSMIDISDGLVQDLEHICVSSQCAAELWVDRVPRPPALTADPELALRGGEDYELLFTVPKRKTALLDRLRPSFDCRITRIGEIQEPRIRNRIRLLAAEGRELRMAAHGFDHFRQPIHDGHKS